MSEEKKNGAASTTGGSPSTIDGNAQPVPQKQVKPPKIVVDPAIQGWVRESDDGKH